MVKISEPKLMAIEVIKTQKAFEIAESSGLFRVPKVLDYDESEGTVILERIQNFQNVHKHLFKRNEGKQIIEKLANSLAIIHKNMILPNFMTIPLPEQFVFTSGEVFLHGDLSVDNVGIVEGSTIPIILDWQSTPLYVPAFTFGTQYFDLLWFIFNMFNRPLTRFIWSKPVVELSNLFLKYYFQNYNNYYLPEDFSYYADKFADIEIPAGKKRVMQNSKGRSRLVWPICEVMAREWLKSLKNKNIK